MSKLDEIQERIRAHFPLIIGPDNNQLELMQLLADITAELKRIDADVKRLDEEIGGSK